MAWSESCNLKISQRPIICKSLTQQTVTTLVLLVNACLGAFHLQKLVCSITFHTKNPYKISEENEELHMGWNPLYM